MENHRSPHISATSFQERKRETARDERYNIEEHHLVQRLKTRDELAFTQLVEQYHTALLGLARKYVRSSSSAEEVVQETWMGVLQRLPFFEERSSLQTWIVRILINRAQTRALRDQHLIFFSALMDPEEGTDTFSIEPEPYPGRWHSLREDRNDLPEACLLSSETYACIAEALQALPASQRAVMVLSDLEGRSPDEICTMLGLSRVNQRVLLHRARAKVKHALEKYRDAQ